MPLPLADTIPRLGGAIDPPVIVGMATLTTAAMHGADADTLATMIDQLDGDPTARLYDTSLAYQLAFRRAEGLGIQEKAVSASPMFRVRRESQTSAGLRLLALVGLGDLMVNKPLDFGNRGQTTGTGMPCAPERQKPGNKMLGFAPINRGVGVL
jgi:hypothetical protein